MVLVFMFVLRNAKVKERGREEEIPNGRTVEFTSFHLENSSFFYHFFHLHQTWNTNNFQAESDQANSKSRFRLSSSSFLVVDMRRFWLIIIIIIIIGHRFTCLFSHFCVRSKQIMNARINLHSLFIQKFQYIYGADMLHALPIISFGYYTTWFVIVIFILFYFFVVLVLRVSSLFYINLSLYIILIWDPLLHL